MIEEDIKQKKIFAKKRFGQHFLKNDHYAQKIVKLANNPECVLEIGPGTGVLTREILKGTNLKKLYAIELDNSITEVLPKDERLEIRIGNALDKNIWEDLLFKNITIISNLPYNVGCGILSGMLPELHGWKQLVLMLQKEVVDRMCATKGSDYGRLSVLCQWKAIVKKSIEVPPSAFIPKPKVDSSVISMHPKPFEESPKFENVEKLIHAMFTQRRKMIRNSLSNDFNYLITEENSNLRPENIPVQKILEMAKKI
jgi:16S rRNA (adenine1518-N6/adenine1519-N6)-dimethyltransferase